MSDSARATAVAQQKVAVWSSYIRAGLAAKESYRAAARETDGYFRNTHLGLFKSEAMKNFLDIEDKGTPVAINKAAMVRSVLAPHLYQQNPKREVNAKRKDSVSIALAHMLEAYLDYTVRESKLSAQVRKSIDDALLRGRGFLRTGFDPEREIITSWHVSSNRVVIDPSALSIEEARWIAISARLASDEVRKRYGKERCQGLTPGLRADQDWEEHTLTPSKYLDDQVIVWDVYSKLGNGLTRGPEAPDEFKNDEDSNLYVKLAIVLDHSQPLEEGEWEVPLYLDKEWPVVTLDFVETLDQLWPESLMGQALIHQKVIDLCATLDLHNAKLTSRSTVVYHPDLFGDDELQQLLRGGPSEAIPAQKMAIGQKLSEMIWHVPTPDVKPNVAQTLAWHMEQFDLITGATALLQGVSDPSGQDRSATASAQKQRATTTRLGDMLAKVEEFCSGAARNEAIACRAGGLVDYKDVALAVGDLDLGWRIDIHGAPIALRGKGSLEAYAPPAATYFETGPEGGSPQADAILPLVAQGIEQAALQEAQGVMSGQLKAEDAKALRLQAALRLGGGQAIHVRKVTPQDVYRDTRGTGPREMVREYAFSVVAGTTQKQDTTAKQTRATNLEQNVLPVALKMGDYATANAVKEYAEDAFEVPEDERMPPWTPPPPPPQPMQPPQGAQQETPNG